MRFHRYLTDNPFRLLGIGSATPYRELASRARSAAHAAKVGLGAQPALAGAFGEEELENCASTVRSLANDPERLTLYRLFWPLTLSGIEDCQSLEDFSCFVDPADEPYPVEVWQRWFIHEWCCFAVSPDTTVLGHALDWHSGLAGKIGLRPILIDLLTADGVSPERAAAAVSSAEEALTDWVATSAVRQATEAVDAGNLPQAVSILEGLWEKHPCEGYEDRIIEQFERCGERLAREVRALTRACARWEPACGIEMPVQFTLLGQLVGTLEGITEDATLDEWRDVSATYISQLGRMIHGFATALAERQGDYAGACELLQVALQLPLRGEVASLVQRTLERYRSWAQHGASDERDARDEAARGSTSHGTGETEPQGADAEPKPARQNRFREAANQYQERAATTDPDGKTKSSRSRSSERGGRRPITHAPGISTYHGIGTMMYGETLFLVVFFIPIFPLARYEFTQKGGSCRFTAYLPFQRWHRIWQAVVGLAWAVWLATTLSPRPDPYASLPVVPANASIAPASSVAPRESKPPPDSKAPPIAAESSTPKAPPVSQAAGSTAPAKVQITPAEIASLLNEQDGLKAELQQLEDELQRSDRELVEDGRKIGSRRKKLDATAALLEQDRTDIRDDTARLEEERRTLDHTDEAAVTAFNERIDALNRRRDAFNEQVRAYQADEAETNEQLQRHNARLDVDEERVRQRDAKQRRIREIDEIVRNEPR